MERVRKACPEKLEQRAPELDILRGIAVLLMICDHFFFDLWGLLPSLFSDYPSALEAVAEDDWYWGVRGAGRAVGRFVFFSLTGVCSSFSKSNLKRAARLLAVALALTAGTFLVGTLSGDIDLTIVFGVLHCIALSLLLVGLLEKIHCGKWVYLALGVTLWGIGLAIPLLTNVRWISYRSEPFLPLLLKSVLGLASCGSDCFDLPSTCGQIFVGVFLGKQFYRERRSLFGWRYRNNLLTFLGRHSLWVYFAHQILLPVLTCLVLLCLGYTLDV